MRARINPEKPNYIYLAEMFFSGKRMIKIGVSNNLPARVQHLRFVYGVEAKMIDVVQASSRAEALSVEKRVRIQFPRAFPNSQSREILDACPVAIAAAIRGAL